MNKLFIFFIALLAFFSCKKQNSSDIIVPNTSITNVTGIPWEVMSIVKRTDTYLYPCPTNWFFNLKDDRSFSIKLHDSISTGTYTWVAGDSLHARVSFSIQSWKTSDADSVYTNRLKDVLSSVDSCIILKYPNTITPPYMATPISLELYFFGRTGNFYLYEW